jgi:RimJ/RimL family protein N-acetyltransferase
MRVCNMLREYGASVRGMAIPLLRRRAWYSLGPVECAGEGRVDLMQKVPSDLEVRDEEVATSSLPPRLLATTDDWRSGLPILTGSLVTLREMRTSDAPSLFIAMAADEVTRFISPPPASIQGFEKFIAWTHRQRAAGLDASFAIVPRGSDDVVGLLQIRARERCFGTAEWGFALAPEFWGSGFFSDASRLAIDFAFDTIGTHRLEARASVANARGNAALRKLGASREGILRRSFLRRGEHHDQTLWSILADEWRDAARWGGSASVIH